MDRSNIIIGMLAVLIILSIFNTNAVQSKLMPMNSLASEASCEAAIHNARGLYELLFTQDSVFGPSTINEARADDGWLRAWDRALGYVATECGLNA